MVSVAIVESLEDRVFQWFSEPDSKSSLKYVPTGNPKSTGGRTWGADVPVPVSATVCGLEGASSPIEKLALSVPARLGVNARYTVHDPPTGTESGLTGQSAACAKSAASSPVMRKVEISSGAVPEFVTRTDSASVLTPTSWAPNDAARVLSVTSEPGAATASGTSIPNEIAIAISMTTDLPPLRICPPVVLHPPMAGHGSPHSLRRGRQM